MDLAKYIYNSKSRGGGDLLCNHDERRTAIAGVRGRREPVPSVCERRGV